MTACPACGHDPEPPKRATGGKLAMFDGETQTGMFLIWPSSEPDGAWEGVVIPFGDDGPYRRALYDTDRVMVRELDPIPRHEASLLSGAFQPAQIGPLGPLGPLGTTASHGLAGGPLPDTVSGGEFWAGIESGEAGP